MLHSVRQQPAVLAAVTEVRGVGVKQGADGVFDSNVATVGGGGVLQVDEH